jgi:hypothetical protein
MLCGFQGMLEMATETPPQYFGSLHKPPQMNISAETGDLDAKDITGQVANGVSENL